MGFVDEKIYAVTIFSKFKGESMKIDKDDFFKKYEENYDKMMDNWLTNGNRSYNRENDLSIKVDIALYHILRGLKEYLPEFDENFHKMFRQADPIMNETHLSGIDTAIWNLLNVSDLFWDTWKSFSEE